MAPSVTQKQHYEDMAALSRAFGEALSASEGRLSDKIDKVSEGLAANRTANAGEFACLQTGLASIVTRLDGKGGILDRVDSLETSETRWRALTAIVSAGAGAFFGWLTGRG
jgi:hypothetical protein